MANLENIKELRARTGAGIMDAKEALAASGDDVEQAITVLRKKGIVKAAKKADRATHEGVVASYIHSNHKVGVLVGLRCETDFVARNEKFQQLARDIALHIAATDPVAVAPDEVDPVLVEAERALAQDQAQASNKPADIQAKIIEGKLKAFREERALLSQAFVKDPSQTVQDLINAAIQELGENISVSEFKRITI